jgi:hypothetical protein
MRGAVPLREFARAAPEKTIGSERPACRSRGEDRRAGKRGGVIEIFLIAKLVMWVKGIL